jgi:hypothetical protein
MPLQGVGHALYPNKWYLSPLCTSFVCVMGPLPFGLFASPIIGWVLARLCGSRYMCIDEWRHVHIDGKLSERRLVHDREDSLQACYMWFIKHCLSEALITVLNCVMVNEFWIGNDVEASGCGIIWGTVQNMFWGINSGQSASGLRYKCVAFWDVLL